MSEPARPGSLPAPGAEPSQGAPSGGPEAREAAQRPGTVSRTVGLAIVPVASIVLALAVGSILILFSGLVGREPRFDPGLPILAYESLIQGATGLSLVDGDMSLSLSIDSEAAGNALAKTAAAAAPLVLTGLAVGVGFKAGLFNIGATGQVLMGGFVAAVVGAQVGGAPPVVAILIATLAGAAAGAFYGFIPGYLKAFTGAHEVVTTIMLNSIAAALISGLVNDILRAPGFTFARTADIGAAAYPIVFGREMHIGVFIALVLVPVTYWFLWRTTIGFEIRTVGANPSAARYAGMSPRGMTVLTMSLAGMFAGLAGTLEILGKIGHYPAVFGTNIGFDGITVALLGRAHPVGIVLAAMLLGGMRAGAPLMQIDAKTPVEIIDVIQAVILFFLAADVLVRRLLRARAARGTAVAELQTVSRSYGEQTAR